MQWTGVVAGIDLERLPDEAIERLAGGEHILSVLADMVQRGQQVAGLLGGSALAER